MENASKALLMAGGILISIIILAVLVRTFGTISSFQKAQLSEEEQAQLVAFNEQYTKYLNEHVYGTEVITVINRALNNKDYEVTVSIKFNGEYTYRGYEEVWKDGVRAWEKVDVTIGAGRTVTIENDEVQDENMQDFINSLGDTDINTMAFKCTNVGYDSNGRVNSIKFEEKQWSHLY